MKQFISMLQVMLYFFAYVIPIIKHEAARFAGFAYIGA
jgi:hypothetical protein